MRKTYNAGDIVRVDYDSTQDANIGAICEVVMVQPSVTNRHSYVLRRIDGGTWTTGPALRGMIPLRSYPAKRLSRVPPGIAALYGIDMKEGT